MGFGNSATTLSTIGMSSPATVLRSRPKQRATTFAHAPFCGSAQKRAALQKILAVSESSQVNLGIAKGFAPCFQGA